MFRDTPHLMKDPIGGNVVSGGIHDEDSVRRCVECCLQHRNGIVGLLMRGKIRRALYRADVPTQSLHQIRVDGRLRIHIGDHRQHRLNDFASTRRLVETLLDLTAKAFDVRGRHRTPAPGRVDSRTSQSPRPVFNCF